MEKIYCSIKKCRREKSDDGYKTCEHCREFMRRWTAGERYCLNCGYTKMAPRQRLCDECRAVRKAERISYGKQWQHSHPEKMLLSCAKHRAKQEGVPFSITESDIVIPDKCPALGIPLYRGKGSGGHGFNSPSLDKIIPELGYVQGNIAVISHRANALKSDETNPQVFRRLADWMEATVSRG
jgi:hypothetical protein